MTFNLRNNQKSGTSIEKDERNHINAPPQTKSQKTGRILPMKVKKIQSTPPPDVNYIITNLLHELTLLNYKNYPIRTKDPFQRRCTQYFRSNTDRRLIGGFVTLITLKKRWVTQKEILDKFKHLKKATVSLVFKHCCEEKWFISQPTNLNPKIQCYQVCDMMLKTAEDYYNFCRSSRNELEFIF